MKKELIAEPLIAVLFLLSTTAAPVIADGCFFPDSVYRDLSAIEKRQDDSESHPARLISW